MFTIANNRQLVMSTSFWDSEHARQGSFFLSGNAGAWRLLVPDALLDILPECATAKWVEFHKVQLGQHPGWRLVFDDRSEAPFCLDTTAAMVVPSPVPTRQKRPLLIHTRSGLQQKHTVRRVMAGGGL